MATALIIAGGVGKRMGMDIPKQFIMVDGKPIIIYTLESFQAHPDVDQILVVCKEGWDETLWGYVHQYKLDKVKWIIKGGTLGQYSINNGVQFLKDHCDDDDIVVIHDGIRPLVDELVLSDVIVKAKEYGNAVTSMPYNEQIFVKKTEETTTQYIDRNTLRRVSTPQAYQFGKLSWAYDKAVAEDIGMTDSSYTNTMMVDLGETLHFAAGSDKNIKLTTTGDLQMFKAYLNMKA
ncbi:2-C-methyl-D-erythritol 4-phosphate cytidylyltransferase [Lactiplantibacillus pentosus]|jgi:2-C-methyl-D-erythritol 4-phosphate cytidylyltransferase|uniref:IspD/TarI family cytidylyltransferase n=1 Tax=Lactiplantibacillus TaxID=2767842 RepID=UPI00195D766A|nr:MULTISPECIES: IspD/TarI family cytidylyltransferase [Lactiplantibacillus]MBU7514441.1 2-C-methyl-D-erythritol 4-phosphate cytidylyltransferase [Lactiplantibacillus pentosus]MCE6032054.1 2-C-methyl-D-erythritol 4-phosphate cytidylyltransferase [Lactiplantibacillus pentosus]QRQ99360.1 2-C-methyl-D-erythritol 4-phosphate cytidylyltransferase [Lactiplantibacillus plantarum]